MSREASPSPPAATEAKPAEVKKEKRFNNGWSHEQEELMAKWADIASCYRWMHDRAEKSFYKKNLSITIPVIVLSTLTGTANFGISSIFGDDKNGQKMASFAIGGVSIIAGVLTTLGNFLRYAQLNEAHRVSGIAWGKFQRQIAVELSLHPNDRLDSMDFIKICRTELDRLIEQSPVIPDSIIAEFQEIFGDNDALEKPEIVGDIDHTTIFRDNRTRLMDIATNAALMMRHKKNLLKEIVNEDLQKQIADAVQRRLSETKKELRQQVTALSAAAGDGHLQLPVLSPRGPEASTTGEHTLKPVNILENSDRIYAKI
jgi:hypothetical protein